VYRSAVLSHYLVAFRLSLRINLACDAVLADHMEWWDECKNSPFVSGYFECKLLKSVLIFGMCILEDVEHSWPPLASNLHIWSCFSLCCLSG